MTKLFLRTSSAVMNTTAALLVATALIGSTRIARADDDGVCPSEPVNGSCSGTCNDLLDVCQKGTQYKRDGTTDTCCLCDERPQPL